MKNSKALNLKQKFCKLTDAQINGVILNAIEMADCSDLHDTLEALFWSEKWYRLEDANLFHKRVQFYEEYFCDKIWFTQERFTKAVNQYFAEELEPKDNSEFMYFSKK